MKCYSLRSDLAGLDRAALMLWKAHRHQGNGHRKSAGQANTHQSRVVRYA
jgi:hypothetical protein